MARIRLAQWPAPPIAGDAPTLLRPATIIEVLPDSNSWEWLLTDSREAFDLSGGVGYERIVGWQHRGIRVSTPQLLAELRAGEHQLNWGMFRGRRVGHTEDELTIAAFDSTWYDVEGSEDVVAVLAEKFRWALSQPVTDLAHPPLAPFESPGETPRMDAQSPANRPRTSSWDAVLLFLLDRSKYREYRFDRDMSRALRPITGTATNAGPTAQSFVDTRLHAIDALEGLVAPSHAWAEVRDSIVGVLRYEIDVVQGKSPADVEEHRSRSAPFVAQLEKLRRGYRLGSRSGTADS